MPEHTKLRSSLRAWIALLCVSSGPATLTLLICRAVPTENAQTVGLVLGIVLGWGTIVVTSQFGRERPAPAPRDDPA